MLKIKYCSSGVFGAMLQEIGLLSREEAINMGLSGPMLRGSGVDWDLRRDMPYGGYENYDFDVPIATEGDCYGRYIIRMQEMRQSVRIFRQAMDNLPDGLYRTDDPHCKNYIQY